MKSVSTLRIAFLIVLALINGGIFVSAQTLGTSVPDPVGEFASQLAAATSEDERNTLLATKKELVTRRLGRILIQRGNVLLTICSIRKSL